MANQIDQYGRIVVNPQPTTNIPTNTNTGRVGLTTTVGAPANTAPTATQAPRVIFGGQKTNVPPPPPAISTVNNTPPAAPVLPTQPAAPTPPAAPTLAGINVSTLGTLLGVGALTAQGYKLYNDSTNAAAFAAGSGNVNPLANTGAFSSFADWVDGQGVKFLGGSFAPAGDSAAGIGAGNTSFDAATGSSTAGQTTLTNAIGYGSFGSALAGLLGLSSGNLVEDIGTGLVGGAVGGAIGGSVGGTILGIGAGPLGAFIGGFALTAITSLFGPKPSDKTAGGRYDPATGEISGPESPRSQPGGDKYSAQNDAAAKAYFSGMKSMNANISTYFGGDLNSMPIIGLNLGSRDGISIQLYDKDKKEWQPRQQFDSGDSKQDATNSLDYVGKYMIMGLRNLPPDLETARKNIDYNQSFTQVSGDMSYAKDFRTVGDSMINGTINMDVTDPKQVDAIVSSWAQRGNKLGLDQDYINSAVSTMKARSTATT